MITQVDRWTLFKVGDNHHLVAECEGQSIITGPLVKVDNKTVIDLSGEGYDLGGNAEYGVSSKTMQTFLDTVLGDWGWDGAINYATFGEVCNAV